MDENSARELIEGAQILFKQRGGEKGAVDEEQDVIDFAFASVVAIAKIKAGDALSESNIWVKRPGTGPFYAEHYDALLGLTADRDIDIDEHISPEMLSDYDGQDKK